MWASVIALRIVIYGDMSGLFAARAYFSLDYLGLGNRRRPARRRTREVESRTPSVSARLHRLFRSVHLTVKARPELVAGLPDMKQIVAGKKTTLVDARPPNEYSGVNAGNGVKRGGHIPGAKNVFWMDNLVNKDNPVLKPAPDMLARYEAAGVKRGKNLVVYCHTGFQASYDYFTLKLLGFNPVLYAGSFLEWSNAPGTAVETSRP